MCLACLYDAPVVSSGLEHTTGSTDGKKTKQNKQLDVIKLQLPIPGTRHRNQEAS